MKKYLAVVLVLMIMFLTISSCFALVIEEMNEEVSEKEKNELIEFIKQYNELILLGYMCEGSFEYDDSVAYGLSEDYLPSKIDRTEVVTDYRFIDQRYPFEISEYINQRYDIFSNVGYLVTDERFNSYEDLFALIYHVFHEWEDIYNPYRPYNSRCMNVYFEFFGNDPFFQKKGVTDDDYELKSTFLSSFRVDDDGKMYTAKPINSYATLYYRYIDIGSIEICADFEYLYVFARGSSEFRDGKVSEPDSDVRMKILRKRTDMDNSFIIESINAKRDHTEYPDLSVMSGNELAHYMIEQYNALNRELLNVDKSKMYKFDDLNVKVLGLESNNYYKVESDIFRSIVDVYDWVNELFYYGEDHFYNLYLGGGFYQLMEAEGYQTNVWAIHFPYLADSEYGLFLSETALEHGFLEIPISDSFNNYTKNSNPFDCKIEYKVFFDKEEGKLDSLRFNVLIPREITRYFCWSADTWMTCITNHFTYQAQYCILDREEQKWVEDNVGQNRRYDVYLPFDYAKKIDSIFGGGLNYGNFSELYYKLIDTKYTFPIINTK